MFPNLARLTPTQNNCLPDPFNRPRNNPKPHERLRGSDAVFWKLVDGEPVFNPSFYPQIAYMDSIIKDHDDAKNAQKARNRILASEVTPTKMPRESVLFHWTEFFPIECKTGDLVATIGYNWTSTSDAFKWSQPKRVCIIVPQGVEVYIDPTSHSHQIPCDDNKELAHQDVVIPPATYQVVDEAEFKNVMGESLQDNVRSLAERSVEEMFNLNTNNTNNTNDTNDTNDWNPKRIKISKRVEKTENKWTLKYDDWYAARDDLQKASYSVVNKNSFVLPAVFEKPQESALVVDFDQFQHMYTVLRWLGKREP